MSSFSSAAPLTIEAIRECIYATDLCADPESNCVYFCLQSHSLASSTDSSEIHRYCLDDNSITRLTHSNHDSLIAIIPSRPNTLRSCIYFLRSGNIYALPLDIGEAVIVMKYKLPVISYKISSSVHDEVFIIACFSVYPSSSIDETSATDKANALNPSRPSQHERLLVRHWNAWDAYSKRHHLFYVSCSTDAHGLLSTAGSSPLDIMAGLEADCPVKGSLGSVRHDDFSISPDGRSIAAISRGTPVSKQLNSDAWTSSLALSIGALSPSPILPLNALTAHTIGASVIQHLAFSPDSTRIAFTSTQDDTDDPRLFVLQISSMTCTQICPHTRLYLSNLAWSPDGHFIYASAPHLAASRIFRLSPEGASAEVLLGSSSVNQFVLINASTIIISSSSFSDPSSLLIADADKALVPFLLHHLRVDDPLPSAIDRDSDDVTTVLCCNPSMVNGDVAMAQVSQIVVSTAHPLLCWFLRPDVAAAASDNCAKLPLVVYLNECCLNAWSSGWNLQWYAAQGYAVLAVDCPGPTDRNITGHSLCETVLQAVDSALSAHGYLDPRRVAVLGDGSLTNALNGHSDRFKCMVSHAGVFDRAAGYYHTDEVWSIETRLGLPWLNADEYAKCSPSSYVASWKTPCLVTHGGRDFRVPETEGIATFTALQRLGIDSKFLYFPDEGHWIEKHGNSIKWHECVANWLKKHLELTSDSRNDVCVDQQFVSDDSLDLPV